MFVLEWTNEAKATYDRVKANPSEKVRCKAVKKTIVYIAQNHRHNSLQTYPFFSLEGPNGEKVFEALFNRKRLQPTEFFGIMGQKEVQS